MQYRNYLLKVYICTFPHARAKIPKQYYTKTSHLIETAYVKTPVHHVIELIISPLITVGFVMKYVSLLITNPTYSILIIHTHITDN